MPTQFADLVVVTTTAFSVNQAPTIVSLVYALAGSVFVSICYLRHQRPALKRVRRD